MTFPILGGNGAVAVGEANSLRFNDDDSPILSYTPSSTATDRKKSTISFWFKIGNVTNSFRSLYRFNDGTNTGAIYLRSGNNLQFAWNTSTTDLDLNLTAIQRDVSAWYHFFVNYDTTQATASDRVNIYINGVKQTAFGTETYPNLNDTVNHLTNGKTYYIGGDGQSSDKYWDGYIAEFHAIDGQTKAHTDFGEFDSTSGIWKVKEYEGTYGNNGFKLDFSDSGSLGADSSGNGNDFTATNLASTDQTTDTPTNNFATWNTVIPMNSTMTMAEGNLEGKTGSNYASGASNTWFSTMGVSSGKWYAEFKMTQNSASYGSLVGVSYDMNTNQQGSTANATNFCQHSSMTSGWGYSNDGSWFNGATYDFSGTDYDTYTTNDIIGVALDLDNSKLYWSKNGTYQNSANPETGSNGISIDANEEYHFAISDTSLSNTFTFQANFGNPVYSISSGNSDDNGYGNFEHAPPSGYLALCTQNLATELSPTIDDASAYFQTLTYAGNSSARTLTNDGHSDLQPDWIWIKSRTGGQWHHLFDSSRGGDYRLHSNSANAESTLTNSRITSFNTDGFSTTDGENVNSTGNNYVAWQWKANGGTTSSNTDGSITSTVQANQTAGFSIVTYTGNGSDNSTIGHGLGKAPAMIILKGRSSVEDWMVYHKDLTAGSEIILNSTSAQADDVNNATWGDNHPSSVGSSTFAVGYAGDSNSNGTTYVAYCFAEIEGYSKFGSYTGNGNGDGTFVYTGFRPAFVIIKRTDSTGQWTLIDTTRQNYNLNDRRVHPNLSDAEYSGDGYGWDMLSNGFKQRSTSAEFNGSGASFIYMAFAEHPFVDSNGVPNTAR